MTTVSEARVRTQVFSRSDALQEMGRLVEQSGMSLEELKTRGAEYALDADKRSLLADIEGLEWMLQS